jgi:3',5'-nucleoside bisphosphate phosphatase
MSEVDLHIHSIFSDDGELGVENIVEISKENNMKFISITDHNSVKGVPRAVECGNKADLEVIPGIEIDCSYNSLNLHVLGYFIDYTKKEFDELEKNIYEQEMKIAYEKIEKLQNNTGLKIDCDEVLEKANGRIITGELIGEILLNKEDSINNELLKPYLNNGVRSYMPYVNFYWDFFSQGKIAYVPMNYISLREAINLIKNSNGVPIIAHPGNNLKNNMDIIDSIIKEGVEGIEVFSSYHSQEQTYYFYNKACEHKVLITCGSDFHGKNKPNIIIGGCNCTLDYSSIINPLKSSASIDWISESYV